MAEKRTTPAQPALCREFVFAGNLSAMDDAREQIMEFVREHVTDQQMELDILVALQEALANAVVHGCRGGSSQPVRCTVCVDPGEISITVHDPGPGFDTAAVANPEPTAPNLSAHGRGILLMRGLMDEVEFRHGGSEVVLRKRRQHAVIERKLL